MNQFYKPKALIIDIDGTLANVEHRRHFVKSPYIKDYGGSFGEGISAADYEKHAAWKADWKSFNASMVMDTSNEWCMILLINMFFGCHLEGDYSHDILFVSGREKRFEEITESQIMSWVSEKYDTAFAWKLFMRENGDYRDDCEVKKEIYLRDIEKHYEVVFCVDDRPKVCRMWRSLGLTCLQCNDKEF